MLLHIINSLYENEQYGNMEKLAWDQVNYDHKLDCSHTLSYTQQWNQLKNTFLRNDYNCPLVLKDSNDHWLTFVP